MLPGEPSRRLMLPQMKIPAHDGAHETVHRKVELRIVPFHCVKKFSYRDFHIEFLKDFASERRLGALPRLDFPAGELPSVFELAVSALRGEDFAVLDDYCRHNSYSF